eukprot:TRINITY_DN12518_c0_g2_i2.p1 TRINITY_DN12518_c0_g2~~TRINITY_DN12518_c0_g2_i2.p1  ORF type:complete len:710 (+),score=136.23 TRINITY_DN12518_c0_g2_i2:205-2334(+)
MAHGEYARATGHADPVAIGTRRVREPPPPAEYADSPALGAAERRRRRTLRAAWARGCFAHPGAKLPLEYDPDGVDGGAAPGEKVSRAELARAFRQGVQRSADAAAPSSPSGVTSDQSTETDSSESTETSESESSSTITDSSPSDSASPSPARWRTVGAGRRSEGRSAQRAGRGAAAGPALSPRPRRPGGAAPSVISASTRRSSRRGGSPRPATAGSRAASVSCSAYSRSSTWIQQQDTSCTFQPVITRRAQQVGAGRDAESTQLGAEAGRWEERQYYEQMTRLMERRRAMLREGSELTLQQRKEVEEWLECTFAPKVNSTKDQHCTMVQRDRTQQEACEELFKLAGKQRRRETSGMLTRSRDGWCHTGDPSDVDTGTATGKEWERQWRKSFVPDTKGIHKGFYKAPAPDTDCPASERLYSDAQERDKRLQRLAQAVADDRERQLQAQRPSLRGRSPSRVEAVGAARLKELYEHGLLKQHSRATQRLLQSGREPSVHSFTRQSVTWPSGASVKSRHTFRRAGPAADETFERLYHNDTYPRRPPPEEDSELTFHPRTEPLPEAIAREAADRHERKRRVAERDQKAQRRAQKKEERRRLRRRKRERAAQREGSPASPPPQQQQQQQQSPGAPNASASSPGFQGFVPRGAAERPPLPPPPAPSRVPPQQPARQLRAPQPAAAEWSPQQLSGGPSEDESSLSNPENLTDEDTSV